MALTYNHAKITDIVSVVPQNTIDIATLLSDTGHEPHQIKRLMKAIGFQQLRATRIPYNSYNMIIEAIHELLNKTQLSAQDIDAVIYVSSGVGSFYPHSLCYLAQHFKFRKDTIFLPDIQGCAAFVYGVEHAFSLINNANLIPCCKKVLIVGDCPVNPLEKGKLQTGNVAIFGNAAIASLISYTDQDCPSYFDRKVNGECRNAIANKAIGFHAIRFPEKLYNEFLLDGETLASFVLGEGAIQLPKQLLAQYNLETSDLEKVYLHQANKSMHKVIMMMHNLNATTAPFNCTHIGNTAAVSIPLSICLDRESLDTTSSKYSMIGGFGTGLSAFFGLLQLKDCHVHEVIEVDM